MPSDASWPLQQAVYTALTGAAAIQALVGNPARVYDEVPPEDQAATFPYITIGDDTVVEMGTKTEDISEHTLTLHAWDRTHRGRKVVKQVLDAIKATLHHASLSVTGHTLVLIHFEFGETLQDADGLTWHGIHRYRCIVQDT